MSKPQPCCDHEQRLAAVEQRLDSLVRGWGYIDKGIAEATGLSGRAEFIELARSAGAGRGHLIAVEGGRSA